MLLTGRLCQSGALVCAVLCVTSVQAQDGDSFVFDDSFLTADQFDTGPSRPSPLRLRLSHQAVAHLNRHDWQDSNGRSGTQAHGLENNRLALNARYQNPFREGWLIQASGWVRAYLPGDYEEDNPSRDGWEWRLNEFFIQRSDSRSSLSLGRQTIVWGETIGNSVLDVINTTEYRDLTVIDIEDARLNQWLATWDYFSDAGTVSSFINLYPEFNPVPVTSSPLFPGSPWRLGSYERGDNNLFEGGIRWSRNLTGSDIAVMAARLYENDLKYSPPRDDMNRADIDINQYTLLGFSANRAIDRLLLTLDVAYSRGIAVAVLDTSGGLQWQDRSMWGISAGFEYGISATRQISVGLRHEKLSGSVQGIVDGRADGQADILVRYSHLVWNEEVTLSATAQAQLDGAAGLLNLAADYRLSDDWELRAQLVLTHSDTTSPLARLDEDVRAGLTLTRSF